MTKKKSNGGKAPSEEDESDDSPAALARKRYSRRGFMKIGAIAGGALAAGYIAGRVQAGPPSNELVLEEDFIQWKALSADPSPVPMGGIWYRSDQMAFYGSPDGAGIVPIIFSAGVSTDGNTAGATIVQPGQLVLVGGNNITLSQVTAAGSRMSVIVSGPAVPAVPVPGAALQDVGTATGSGTDVTRFAADDHVHRGQVGWDVNGIATTFYGMQELSAGAMLSIATGGNSTAGTAQFIDLWSSATAVSRVESGNVLGAMASRVALEGHQHAGIWAVDVGGNTAGNTSSGAGSLRLAGGPNVTLSGSTAAGGMTLSISIPNSAAAPVVSNAIQDVGTATGSGTDVTRFAADDHVHRGIVGLDVNGIASTFYGTAQLSAGALMSLATGGASTRGSIQVINLLSSATTASRVESANAVGAMASRFALEAHQHAGLWAIDVGGNTAGNTSSGAGSLQIAGGPNVTLSGSTAAGGMTLSVSVPNSAVVPVVSGAIQDVGTATGSGTDVTRFAADDHVHRGQIGWDINGIASTFFGTQQLSAGALMSIATGGGSTRGTAQFINLLSSATTVSSVATANAVGAMASRFALEGHQHGGVPTVSVVGNTAGNTTQGNMSLILAGGPNVTLSGSTVAGAMTLSVSVSNATSPVAGAAIQDVGTATGSGTDTSRFAADDHVHRGVVGIDINGIASTFYGTAQLSAGAMMSLATGGASTRGSIQFIDLWSSATTASQVTTGNVVGAMASRLALEGHQHAGVHGLVVSGTASTFLGDFTFNSGAMISFATAGNSTAGSMSIIDLWSSATTVSRDDSANAIGAMASRVALEGHQHAALWQQSVGGNTAGSTSAGAGSYMLAGGPGVTLSGSTVAGGQTLSISAVPNVLLWDNLGLGATNTLQNQDASMLVFPLAGDNADLFPGNMTASTVMLDMSGSVSTGAAFSMSLSLGFFTLNNSTQLSRVFSASTSWGSNGANAGFTSLFQGLRFVTLHSSQFDVQPTFSRTNYWAALWMRSSSGSQTWTLQGQQFLASAQRSGTMAAGNAGGTSLAWFPLMGVRSASFSTAMPGAIAQSDLNKAVAGAGYVPHIHMEATISSF